MKAATNRDRALSLASGLALLVMLKIGTAAAPGAVRDVLPPLDGVDAHIAPGDDFFGYANGAWIAAATVPAGKPKWGARDDINVTTKQQIETVITTAGSRRDDAAASKVADFHAAYLDEAAIETAGLKPLQTELRGIAAIRDRRALARWLGANLPADGDPLNQAVYDSSFPIGLSVEYGIHGEPGNFAYLVQGGLGLDSREAYLDDSAEHREQRERYRQYVARMLELGGVAHAAERANAVLALETALARTHANAEESASDHNADHHWSRADFDTNAPGMDWSAFFTAAGLGKQNDFVAWQPAALTGVAALSGSEPLDAWQDYLRFHLLDRYAFVLPKNFAQAAQTYRGDTTARNVRAIDLTNRLLPMQVGKLYVDQYFPFGAKASVQATYRNVLAAFRRRAEATPWMNPSSRAVALEKLDAIYFGVGYPDKWPDDSALKIDGDALGNVRRIAAWNRKTQIAMLDKPADRHDWSISPQSAIATLNFLQNSYNFSAALLQPPKFDPAGSDAANYGAIGAIMGHEISHFVDTLGMDYDVRGGYAHWWTASDRSQYDAASKALEDQFSTYRPFADIAIDGKNTASENVADLAGLQAAFEAYRRALGSRADDRQYRLQQDREFFLGFARAYRARYTEAGLRAQSTKNDHAPEMFRVSTVRNLDAWYEAFDVQPGQKLYLDPQARVRVW